MSQEVARLEELLARVQRNAAQPRAARGFIGSGPAASLAAAPIESNAVAFAPPPAEATAEPVFSPPPAAYAPPPTLTDSVDDLLADPFPASSAPPPVAEEAFDEQPIPLVAVASASERVSGVVPVTELGEEPPEELLEDDIVEMSPSSAPVEIIVPASRSSLEDVDLNFDDEDDAAAQRAHESEEEPPASSSRSKVPGTMDEALARAAEQMEIQEGREVPLKTPPPESGPQAAAALPAGIHAPPAPDIDELLEADILPVSGISAAGPTTEQLGQTIDLEEARGPQLELDHPRHTDATPEAERPSEELEIALPQREFGGGYQEDLMPPPEARQDLDAHLQRVGAEADPAGPESLAQYPSLQPAASASGIFSAATGSSVTTESPSEAVSTVTIEAPSNADFSPELLARPELSPGPIAKFIRAEAPRPSTFLELLDASLTLGRQ